MGWLFTYGQTLKGMIVERTQPWEHTTPEEMLVKSVCLRHCYRGGSFSGVLWTVWERTFTKEGQSVKPTERWIGCDLLQYSKRDNGWGFKDQEESMNPYTYSCPLGYLAMVPTANENWRAGVHVVTRTWAEIRPATNSLRASSCDFEVLTSLRLQIERWGPAATHTSPPLPTLTGKRFQTGGSGDAPGARGGCGPGREPISCVAPVIGEVLCR